MVVILASMFRTSERYLDRYFAQVNALRETVDVDLVIAEGDSSDDTYAQLQGRVGDQDILVKADHYGPVFGGVDHPRRWANIAIVARAIINAAKPVLADAEAFIWVESDLVWSPEALKTLLADSVPAVAPMVLHPSGDHFYDIWGFRKDGTRFGVAPPYHSGIDGLTPIDSCGSCFVLRPAAFPSLLAWDGMWPFAAGGDLQLDPSVVIRHP